MSKFLFNSFASNIKSQVSCFHLSPFLQKRLILRLGEAGTKFHRKSVPERKHAFSLLYSDCTDGLFDIGGLFHTEVIKAKGRTIRKVMGGRGIFDLQEFFFATKFLV